jgi:hypothetical protein
MTALTTSSPRRPEGQTAPPEPGTTPRVPYNVALGYLRAATTVLVVAHHAVLAYVPFAPAAPASLTAQPPWWKAFPVVDAQRFAGFSVLVGFNDTFFMSLMFFLSGLFVWNSLERKGAGAFLRDRFLRLGIPFVGAAALVAPLAYYPTFLQSGAAPSLRAFGRQWLSLSDWPAGPAWFVWVLLAFALVAALLSRLMPQWGERLGRRLSAVSARPARFFLLLVSVSGLVYIPMSLVFNPLSWSAFGPFTFQTSRIFHYLAYFLIGGGLGAWGSGRGLLAPDGKLARCWPAWAFSSAVAFALAVAITIVAVSSPSPSLTLRAIGGLVFVLCCAASSFAFLAFFLRFARSRSAIFDSLRDNAYGIYLVHYAFVSWLQYAMLKAGLPAVQKGSAVFLGALMLSWAASAMMRRIPGVARVI